MRKITFTLLLFLFLVPGMHGQHWVDLMLDGETDLPTVKAAFDAEWEGRGYERGKGWKQFHRWYWFMEQRSGPNGERPDPAVFLEAMEEMKARRQQRGGMRDASVWESLGPTTWNSFSYNPGNGRVNVVAIHPNDPSIIYAGTPSGGLWRKNSSGWVPLFTDLPSMGVSGIVIHPTSPDTIYIATGDGDGADTFSAGVLMSPDGGNTWESTGLDWNIGQARTTRALRMHHNQPEVMYCAASNGLFRTEDGALTWDQQLSGSFRDVAFMPGDTTIVYACSDRFYRSGPEGSGFSPAGISGLPPSSQVSRMAIGVTPADPMVVYVLCGSAADQGYLGLYRSDDGGFTFSLRSDQPNIMGYSTNGDEEGGQAWYDMALAVNPDDADVVYVGGINVWKSNDGGSNWSIRSHWVYPSEVGYTHADIHSLDVINGNLYCGSDGGLFVSTNGASSWTDLSAGLDITQFYRMGGSELLPNLIMAGAQDNGSNRFLDEQWTHVYGADGMECAVDPAVPTTLYASFQLGGIIRSTNNGVSFTGIGENIDDEGAWVTPFALDRTLSTRILAGYRNVWISYDRGDNWAQATDWNNSQFVRCVTFAPSDGEVMYAARRDRAQRSTDGGILWEDIRNGLPNLVPTSIAVDHEDAFHVWISFAGDAAGNKVYESLDGGNTWTNRSAGLPNISVNSVVTQPGSPNAVYAGTDMGVFYRDDMNPEWEPFGDGLPNVVVSELEVNWSLGKLRAATYGRGVWEADLYMSPFASVPELAGSEGPLLVPIDMEGRYSIRTDEGTGRVLHVRVLDALGRDLRHRAMGGSPQMLDLSTRAAGTYIAVITTEHGTWVRRVALARR